MPFSRRHYFVKHGIGQLLFTLLFLPLLTSCSHIQAYPKEWAPIRPAETDNFCPNISGVYLDEGELVGVKGGFCSSALGQYDEGKDRHCKSLSYNLLSSHYYGYTDFFKDAYGNGAQNNFPKTKYVRIDQQKNNIIKISLYRENIDNKADYERILSQKNGNFSCEQSGLRLPSYIRNVILIISNKFALEYRYFQVTETDDIVMKTKLWETGNHTFFLYHTGPYEGWVRWKRMIPATSNQSPEPTE